MLLGVKGILNNVGAIGIYAAIGDIANAYSSVVIALL